MNFKIDIHFWFIFTLLFLCSLGFFIAWYIIIPFLVRKRQRDRMSQKLKLKNEHLRHIDGKINEKELMQLEKDSSLLKSDLSESLTDALKSNESSISETFFIKFNQIYPEFNAKIAKMNTGITDYELKLCALLKLNLTSKEIGKLTNIDQASVNKARYRIRKKLDIDSKDNLHMFFNNI